MTLRRCIPINHRHFKPALLAAVAFVWAISLSINRPARALPAQPAGGSVQVLPAPHSPVGIDYGVILAVRHPCPVSTLKQAVHVTPPAPFHLCAEAHSHYAVLPDHYWPSTSMITVSIHQGQFRSATTFTTGDPRILRVNLADQTMEAYEGPTRVRVMPVSTGVYPQWKTPTGTFWIYKRVRDDHMTGGIAGTKDSWDVEHVPYAQYIYQGIAIHGAWWNHQFGIPRSHGCIQLSTAGVDNARWVWQFADIGTPVIVYGQTPRGPASPSPYPAE